MVQTRIAFRKAYPCWQFEPRNHLRAEVIQSGVMKATGISDDQQLFMYFNFGKDAIQLKAPSGVDVLLFSADSRWHGTADMPARYGEDESVHLPGASMFVMQNASS